MKKIIFTVLLMSFGTHLLAESYCIDPNQRMQRFLKSDHISCRVEAAKTTLKNMIEKHQNMDKEEIIQDLEQYAERKLNEIEQSKKNAKRNDRESFELTKRNFLDDFNVFMDEVIAQESGQDILLLESDIISELNEFDYSAYGSTISQVRGEGAVIGLFFGAILDGVSAPFQAINNEIQYSETKWSRELASFLINY